MSKKPQIQSCINFSKIVKNESFSKGVRKTVILYVQASIILLFLTKLLNEKLFNEKLFNEIIKRKIPGSVMTSERVYPSHQLNVDNKLKCTVSFFNQMLEARFA